MIEYILYMCVYLSQSLSYIEIFVPSVVLLCWSNPAGKFSGTVSLTVYTFPC